MAVVPPKQLYWFLPSKNNFRALVAGFDAREKKTLYVCGSYLWGSFQLGLADSNKKHCHIPYLKRTYTVDMFYLLKAQAQWQWQNVEKKLPRKTLFLGVGLKKSPLALCRGFVSGSLLPGKTWVGHHTCKIIYKSKVIELPEYAVLVNGTM